MAERFEYRSENSNKFWEPRVQGENLTVNFGRIDTRGQIKSRAFTSSEKAGQEMAKVIREKLAKGYRPTHDTILRILENSPSGGAPEAIGSVCLTEHMEDELISNLTDWLTACIHYRMDPEQFSRSWNKFLEGDEEITGGLGEELAEEILGYPDGASEVPDLYEEAYKSNADRFIPFNDNGFISVVAAKGDPGAKAIEQAVLDNDQAEIVTAGGNLWPDELGPGSPILSLTVALVPAGRAILRGGREIEVNEYLDDEEDDEGVEENENT